MTRSKRATFLILAISWQALVWLTPWGQDQRLADLSNTFAHAQAVSLDHHDDHSSHVDDYVTDGAQHHHSCDALQLIGLMPVAHGFNLDLPPSAWPITNAAPLAAVFLQGPLRPPEPRVT